MVKPRLVIPERNWAVFAARSAESFWPSVETILRASEQAATTAGGRELLKEWGEGCFWGQFFHVMGNFLFCSQNFFRIF